MQKRRIGSANTNLCCTRAMRGSRQCRLSDRICRRLRNDRRSCEEVKVSDWEIFPKDTRVLSKGYNVDTRFARKSILGIRIVQWSVERRIPKTVRLIPGDQWRAAVSISKEMIRTVRIVWVIQLKMNWIRYSKIDFGAMPLQQLPKTCVNQQCRCAKEPKTRRCDGKCSGKVEALGHCAICKVSWGDEDIHCCPDFGHPPIDWIPPSRYLGVTIQRRLQPSWKACTRQKQLGRAKSYALRLSDHSRPSSSFPILMPISNQCPSIYQCQEPQTRDAV